MSSFLEGIESNAADVGPPEPPATLASTEDRQQQQQQQRAQPSPSKGPGRVADKQSLWSSTARDGASSGISSTFPSSIESAPLNPMGYGAGGYATSLMREDVSGETINFPPRTTEVVVAPCAYIVLLLYSGL